jgi:hypothetical protein
MVQNQSKLPDYSAKFKEYPILLRNLANVNREFPRRNCTLRQQENRRVTPVVPQQAAGLRAWTRLAFPAIVRAVISNGIDTEDYCRL